MIISITGKPCSGKGATSELFCSKYGFEYISTSKKFRETAIKLKIPISDFSEDERIKKVDKVVDEHIIKIGKKRLNDNLLLDSRLAWHFIPASFKVFLDVSWKEAGKRLVSADRADEQADNEKEAIAMLKKRWNAENKRYKVLYGIDNLEKSNYNLVIKTDNMPVEDVVEKIYKAYTKFMQKKA